MMNHLPRSLALEGALHIEGLYRDAGTTREEAEIQRKRLRFLSSFTSTLRRGRAEPSLQSIGILLRLVPVTLEGAFRLVGYDLERVREIDFLLNGHRTRIIESYPFSRDFRVNLPAEFAGSGFPQRSAFLSEIVLRWQMDVAIRSARGPGWKRDGFFYAQIGAEDNGTLSGLPAGAFVSVERLGLEEQVRPDPEMLYLLLFGNGYRCCKCTISNGKLILLPRSNMYAGAFGKFSWPICGN
jgi:hypothetical protein